MKCRPKIIKSIAASSVGFILMMHSPGAAAAACGTSIIPTQIVIAPWGVDFLGTVQWTSCPCANSNMVHMSASSDSLVSRWEGLLLTAKATGRPVYAYSSTSTCGAGWWASYQLVGEVLVAL